MGLTFAATGCIEPPGIDGDWRSDPGSCWTAASIPSRRAYACQTVTRWPVVGHGPQCLPSRPFTTAQLPASSSRSAASSYDIHWCWLAAARIRAARVLLPARRICKSTPRFQTPAALSCRGSSIARWTRLLSAAAAGTGAHACTHRSNGCIRAHACAGWNGETDWATWPDTAICYGRVHELWG